ncbi:MAG: hypothetical protein PPHEINF_4841 [uncultured Paraburkholderia sp.]|nr:MAG: hypothetical protein PPHEINF_4841 [uncultured Paraburkholderia sp.]
MIGASVFVVMCILCLALWTKLQASNRTAKLAMERYGVALHDAFRMRKLCELIERDELPLAMRKAFGEGPAATCLTLDQFIEREGAAKTKTPPSNIRWPERTQ